MEEQKLSSGSQEKRAQVLGELARELRQFTGLGASFFRAAAARIGITVTDMQVIDVLNLTGPMTAGQLADLTGLTTGAITGMLNRLEEAGLVRRERDPSDGRRVIVRLVPDKDEMQKIDSIFDSLGDAWDEMASHYDDELLAFLLEFLKRSNALSRKEIVRLREAPEGEGGLFSAPLGDLESGRLVVSSGLSRLTVRAGDVKAALYQARFEGPMPDVKAKDGVVTIRYPRRLWVLGGEQRAAEVTLKRHRSPCDALQASPHESISRAGSPHLSSTIKPSAMWATTCGCKALATKRLPRATISKSPAAPAWSPSPPVDDEPEPQRARDRPVRGNAHVFVFL